MAIAKRTPSAIGCCAGPDGPNDAVAEGLAASLELEERQEGRCMIEDVETRSLLDDCGNRDERDSSDERTS